MRRIIAESEWLLNVVAMEAMGGQVLDSWRTRSVQSIARFVGSELDAILESRAVASRSRERNDKAFGRWETLLREAYDDFWRDDRGHLRSLFVQLVDLKRPVVLPVYLSDGCLGLPIGGWKELRNSLGDEDSTAWTLYSFARELTPIRWPWRCPSYRISRGRATKVCSYMQSEDFCTLVNVSRSETLDVIRERGPHVSVLLDGCGSLAEGSRTMRSTIAMEARSGGIVGRMKS